MASGLEQARSLLAAHDWRGAHDAADAAVVPEAREADRLDVLADASWWLGRLDACIEARERAYVLYDERADHRRAGQSAVWLYEHHCFKARPAIAGAWLTRARNALADDPECVEHGALLLREAEAVHGSGDLERAADQARQVVALGRRLRSADLEAEALQTLGRVLIDQGRPAEGLARMDEAMLFATEGRLGPYATGKVYCSLVSACEELGDLRRAAEWTEATLRWSEKHPFAVFPGLCRVHRASALQWRGSWEEAEREASRACEELAAVNLPNAAAGFVEIAEIRRRLGDLEGAEAALGRAEVLSGHPSAGLALLRLAQGRVEEASSIVRRSLEDVTWNRLARARLLAASVQVDLARGDTCAAAEAVEELEAVARDYDSPVLLASAATCRGRLEVSLGDSSACGTLRAALVRWQELEVPYEVATTRLLLGLACRGAADDEGAVSAFSAAEAMFVQLGAALDIRHVRGLATVPRLPGGLTEREAQVLRLVAAGSSNRDVATELFLSEKTVARHLSNIFTKLDVPSRAAATAFAYRHGLVTAQG